VECLDKYVEKSFSLLSNIIITFSSNSFFHWHLKTRMDRRLVIRLSFAAVTTRFPSIGGHNSCGFLVTHKGNQRVGSKRVGVSISSPLLAPSNSIIANNSKIRLLGRRVSLLLRVPALLVLWKQINSSACQVWPFYPYLSSHRNSELFLKMKKLPSLFIIKNYGSFLCSFLHPPSIVEFVVRTTPER